MEIVYAKQPDQAESFRDYCIAERNKIEADWERNAVGRRAAYEEWVARGGVHNGG